MKATPHRWSAFGKKIDDRSHQKLEWQSVDFRERAERAYAKDPKATHEDLVYIGYWTIAAQLRIDYQAGRLS